MAKKKAKKKSTKKSGGGVEKVTRKMTQAAYKAWDLTPAAAAKVTSIGLKGKDKAAGLFGRIKAAVKEVRDERAKDKE